MHGKNELVNLFTKQFLKCFNDSLKFLCRGFGGRGPTPKSGYATAGTAALPSSPCIIMELRVGPVQRTVGREMSHLKSEWRDGGTAGALAAVGGT